MHPDKRYCLNWSAKGLQTWNNNRSWPSPSGTSSGGGVYLTVYPSSLPITDTNSTERIFSCIAGLRILAWKLLRFTRKYTLSRRIYFSIVVKYSIVRWLRMKYYLKIMLKTETQETIQVARPISAPKILPNMSLQQSCFSWSCRGEKELNGIDILCCCCNFPFIFNLQRILRRLLVIVLPTPATNALFSTIPCNSDRQKCSPMKLFAIWLGAPVAGMCISRCWNNNLEVNVSTDREHNCIASADSEFVLLELNVQWDLARTH